MSSRLFRGGLGVETNKAIPIVWRKAGSDQAASGYQGAAPEAGTPTRKNAPEQPDPAIEARVQAAYNKGIAEGEATAQQRAGALAAPVLSNFGSILQELAAARKNARQEAEESMVQLALAIARRILHREMASDPEAILGLVRAGFDRVNSRETYKLRLSPGDAQIVIDNRTDLRIPTAMEILPDGNLPPGSAIFETARGELDLSVQTQLEEIERGFADLVVRGQR